MPNESYEEGEVVLTVSQNIDSGECECLETAGIRPSSVQGAHSESFDIDSVFKCFRPVRLASHYKPTVQSYWWYQLRYSYLISKDLKNHCYEPQPVDKFVINERGHIRHIKANKVNDRVVNTIADQHILRPRTEPKLILDNGASRPGLGTDHSRARLEKHCHDAMINFGPDATIALFDLSNFFGSIPQLKLLKMYRELIDIDEEYDLIELLVFAHNEVGKGVGIGSVISQNAGIYYLHRFDNYMKIVLGRKYYGRYMDDFYVICRNKEESKQLRPLVKSYIEDECGLKLNERKSRVALLTNGFTYLKFHYRVSETGKIYKRQASDTFKRERKKLKRFMNTKMSDEDIVQAYKSWRGSVAKYPYNQPRLYKTDQLFKELYPHLVEYVNF